MKGKENCLQKNGKQFCKICRTLKKKMRCHSFKIKYIIDTIVVFRTQSHIEIGLFAIMVTTLLRFVCMSSIFDVYLFILMNGVARG